MSNQMDAATLRAIARLREALDYPRVGVVPYVELASEDAVVLLDALADAAAPRPVETPHECRSWPGGWTCHICGKHYTVAAPNDERTHITWDKDGNRVVTPLDSEGRRLAAHPRRCSKCPCRWDGAPQACPECGGPSVALARAVAFLNAEFSPWSYTGAEPVALTLANLLSDRLAAPASQATLAEAWWRGRCSANERQGEWAGPELRERCAKDIADLAAPVGEQEKLQALRVAVMVVVSNPDLTWPQARAELTKALNEALNG